MGVMRVVILCTKGEISEQRRKGNGYENVKLAKEKKKKFTSFWSRSLCFKLQSSPCYDMTSHRQVLRCKETLMYDDPTITNFFFPLFSSVL